MTNLRQEDFQGPITCLKFIGAALYCGSGPYLKRYESGRLASMQKIFACNKIHGICAFRGDLVVYGGRSIAFGPDFVEHTVQDWIISATPHGDELYILLAHNKVVIYPSLETREYDQSILYSGCVHVAGDRVLVAAGTVLHGVVVWDLTTQQLVCNFTEHSGSIFNVAFGDNGVLASCSDDRCIILWDLLTKTVRARLWGHTSRIWKLLFLGEQLFSISEDLSCRIWGLDGSCRDVLTGHSGRNVWALDVALHEGRPLIATGGQDGRVKLWQKYLMDRVQLDKVSDDPYKSFCSLRGEFVYTTASGRVYVGAKLLDVDVGNYSVVKAVGKSVLVCSKLGFVLCVDPATAEHKVHEIPLQGHFTFCGAVSATGLLLQGQPSDPLLELSLDGVQRQYPAVDQAVTAAHSFEGCLVVGTRTGALAVFKDEWTQHRPFGRDAITAISSDPEGGQSPHSHSHLAVASRSGTYGLFDGAQLVYTNKLQRGGIEGLQYQANGDLLAYGFSKEYFIMHNLTHEYQVASENCGGGHRTWSFAVDVASESLYELSYVKAGVLHRSAYTGRAPPFPSVVVKGCSGREIRGIEFHPLIAGLVATVSEDTTVQLGKLVDNRVDVGATFRRHATPPQAVHWRSDGRVLATAGAKEELLFWRLSGDRYLVEDGALPVARPSDLRIMDFAWAPDFKLVCVYSDSTIRLWDLNTLEVVKTAKYSDKCLLHVHAVGAHIIAVATDGQVLVYNSDLQLKHTLRAHQSGVRGSWAHERGGAVYHLSGGEDQALVGVRVDAVGISQVFRTENAHAATICDVAMHGGYIYSTGPDQKVSQWTLQGQLVKTVRTPVSDAGCLAIQGDNLLVAGVGVGILSL